MSKVDYDQLADNYDAHRRGGGPYMAALLSLARDAEATRVLELGAGTGNNTAAFLSAFPCDLIALEPSAGMTSKAVAKSLLSQWIRGAAEHIPLADASVDLIFGCYFLHYIRDLRTMFQECARVLRGGAAAFVTASVDFIERHPMNRYFPSFAAVDKGRFQSEDEIRDALIGVGFRDVRADPFAGYPRPIDQEYVNRVANKFISTYGLLPPEEYEAGLERLRTDVAKKGKLDVDIRWEGVTVSGRL